MAKEPLTYATCPTEVQTYIVARLQAEAKEQRIAERLRAAGGINTDQAIQAAALDQEAVSQLVKMYQNWRDFWDDTTPITKMRILECRSLLTMYKGSTVANQIVQVRIDRIEMLAPQHATLHAFLAE